MQVYLLTIPYFPKRLQSYCFIFITYPLFRAFLPCFLHLEGRCSRFFP